MAETFTLGIILRLRDEASKGVHSALGGIEKLGEEADETQRKVQNLSRGFQQLRDAGLGLTAMGAAAGAALYSLVRPAAAVQEQVTNALTLTGATGEAFTRMERGMTESAVRLSTRLGISADAVAEGFYQVLSTGVAALTPEFDALSETALKMAKTVGMAPADAVEVLADTVNEFQMNMTQAARVADVFFTASKLSTLTVPQLVASMREAGSAAGGLNIPLEDVATILAGFASKGVKGAKAGTAFRILLVRLAKPPREAAEAMRRLGLQVFTTTGKVRPLVDIFKDMQRGMAGMTEEQKAGVLKAIAGEEAFAKLAGVLNTNLDILQDWRTAMAESGTLELAFTQKMGTLVEQANVLWVSVRNLAEALGAPLLGPLTGIAMALARVVQVLAGFSRAHPVLGLFAGAALGLVAVVGLLGGAFLTLTGMVGLLALKWLPLATTGFTLMRGAVAKAVPTLLGWTRALWASASAGRIHAVMTLDLGAALRRLAFSVWANVKAFAAWTIVQMRNVAVRAALLAGLVVTTAAAWGSAIASKAAAAAQWLWNAAMTANPIGLIVVGVAALVAGLVLLIRNWDAVTAAVGRAFGWFRDLLSKAPDWLLALVFPAGLVIKHWEAVRTAIGGAVGWLAGALARFKGFLAGVPEALLALASPAAAIARSWEELKKAIGGIIEWLAAKVAWVTGRFGAVLDLAGRAGSLLGLTNPAGPRGAPVGGQTVVPATAPASQRAEARPSLPPRASPMALPAMALAGAGTVDNSITIEAGAIQVHAVRVDDEAVRRIDFELAKRMRRRQERR